jgi:hypothetical protein
MARSAEPASDVIAAALAACSTDEFAMKSAWEKVTTLTYTADFVFNLRQTLVGQIFPKIVAIRSHPATPATSPAKAKEVAI